MFTTEDRKNRIIQHLLSQSHDEHPHGQLAIGTEQDPPVSVMMIGDMRRVDQPDTLSMVHHLDFPRRHMKMFMAKKSAEGEYLLLSLGTPRKNNRIGETIFLSREEATILRNYIDDFLQEADALD